MRDELSSLYFRKALEAAKGDELTKAVRYAAVSLGVNQEKDESRKLAGLCYNRLGNYTMAEYCFNNSPYYIETVKDILEERKNKIKEVGRLVDRQQYKIAVKTLEKENDKNVNEYNYLGCLYAALQKKEKATACFLKALEVDNSNPDTLYYLKSIQYTKEKRWWRI